MTSEDPRVILCRRLPDVEAGKPDFRGLEIGSDALDVTDDQPPAAISAAAIEDPIRSVGADGAREASAGSLNRTSCLSPLPSSGRRAYPRRMGVQVLPATGRWDDFAVFMVPRKPGGGGCVCMAYRNSSLDMPGRIAHMRALCAGDPGPGVLA